MPSITEAEERRKGATEAAARQTETEANKALVDDMRRVDELDEILPKRKRVLGNQKTGY